MKIGLDFGNVIKQFGGPIMEGALEGFQNLKNIFGKEIYIISRVNDDAGARKVISFLRENNLLATVIPLENINFTLLRCQKAAIAKQLGLTHFVDDRPECLSYMSSVKYCYAMNPTPDQLIGFS